MLVSFVQSRTRIDATVTLIAGRVFRVKSSPVEPEAAYVRVLYRGHWFYIADADLNTKTTFSLLTHLCMRKESRPDARDCWWISEEARDASSPP
jgi:hypothetical protein